MTAPTTNYSLFKLAATGNTVADYNTGQDTADTALKNALDAKISTTLDASLSNGQYEGPTKTLPAKVAITAGQLLYMVNDTTLKWDIVPDTTDEAAEGIAVAAQATPGQNVTALRSGRICLTGVSWAWTLGATLYRHATTHGAMQEGAPSTTGQKVQRIGKAESATIIEFNPSMDVGEVA